MQYPISSRAVLALAFFSFLGLSSCDKLSQTLGTNSAQDQAASPDSTAATADTTAAARAPEWVLTYPKGSPYQDLTPPKGMTSNPFEEIPRIIETHKDNPNWADKHADIKGVLLQNMRKDYLFVLQQQGANEMLRHELFSHYYQDMDNVAVLRTIAFYTEQLEEAKSEDSELIYKCLRALKGHWEDRRIAEVALSTAKRVQARPITAASDTTSRIGNYQQVYARELKKMAQKLLAAS
jgi:hypothetical protein